MFHSSVSKMEDKRNNDSNLCKDSLQKKTRARKGRPMKKVSRMAPFVGVQDASQTVIAGYNHQTRDSNPDSCEEGHLDIHYTLPAEKRNIEVKEELVPCGEEDASKKGEEKEEQVSSRTEDPTIPLKVVGKIKSVHKSPSNQHKQSSSDILKINAGRSKEISEDLRKQVVEAHKNGKGYKRIAKDLNLHLSTVRKIVYKWKKFSTVATLPRSGRPTKISAKARSTILKYMMENTKVSARDLKASLALDNINVHESTIRKTMSKWCSWDFNIEETIAPQKE